MAADDQTHMEFVRAPDDLPGLVASTVGYRADGRRRAIHRGLPSPFLTFIVSLDDPITTGESPEHAQGPSACRNEIIVSGLHLAPAYVVQPSREAGIQLAVHPLGARAIFGAPAAELRPLAVEGVDVLGVGAARLRAQLLDEPDWASRFVVLADYLRRRMMRMERTSAVRPEVAEAWTWIARHRGAGSVHGLAEHVALSARQLTTLFHRELGVTPKEASRLMRFNHASQRIAATLSAGRALSLAEVAHHCGYYDQSHLVRDFRAFTGTSPTRWIDEEHRNIQAGGHRNGAELPT